MRPVQNSDQKKEVFGNTISILRNSLGGEETYETRPKGAFHKFLRVRFISFFAGEEFNSIAEYFLLIAKYFLVLIRIPYWSHAIVAKKEF